MSKAQKHVNKIYAEYGLDVSNMSDQDIEDLMFALSTLKEMDRDDVTPPEVDGDEDYLDEEEIDFDLDNTNLPRGMGGFSHDTDDEGDYAEAYED